MGIGNFHGLDKLSLTISPSNTWGKNANIKLHHMEFKSVVPMHNWSFFLGTTFINMLETFLFVWIFFNLDAFSLTVSLNHLNTLFFSMIFFL